MTEYNWFLIFNLASFEATGLISRTYTVDLLNIGTKDVLVTKGNLVSLTYDGIMLSLNLLGANPFEMDGHACYLDDNGNVWLGTPVTDET